MKVEIIEPLWNDDDKDIQMVIPFTDPRERIDIKYDDGTIISNQTYSRQSDYNQFGANIVYNHTWEDIEEIPNQTMNMTLVVAAKSILNTQTPDY